MSRRLTTLALDLGTSCGWALRTVDGLITSGTAVFRPGRFEGGGMRYLRFRGWLDEMHATGNGNADKAAMVAAMRARGFQPGDDNEADSLALLCWAEENQPLGAGAADGQCLHPRAETLTGA